MEDIECSDIERYRIMITQAAECAQRYEACPPDVLDAALRRLGVGPLAERRFARYTARIQVVLDAGTSTREAKSRVAEYITQHDRKGYLYNEYETGGHVSVPGSLEWQLPDGRWLSDAAYWRQVDQEQVAPIGDLAELKARTCEVFRELALANEWDCSTTWRWWRDLDLGPQPRRIMCRAKIEVTGLVQVEVPTWEDTDPALDEPRLIEALKYVPGLSNVQPTPGSALIFD